ncbi:MAG: sensor histidine kinase [Candidatus Nanopelagicales bacterium]|nr:sensor histidine kinase [Candidatus Nanopelagicales bacterium]
MAEQDAGQTPRAVVRREVLRFAIPGVIGVLLLATASLVVSVAVAREQSVNDARTTAEWLARTVVEPRIDDGLKTGKPARMAELDAAFSASISGSDVKAIRLWNADGVIIYSNDPRLIGERFPMPSGIADDPVQGMADPDRPENRYLDPQMDWVQVSLPVVGADGSSYLFQISKLQDSLRQEARDVWVAFAPIIAGSLLLLTVLLVLLAVRMARRISAELRAREELLQRAVDASETERSRIAADLHDGTVQHLAGLSFALAGLAARAEAAGDHDSAALLSDAAGTTRTSVRELRTLLVDIYPPNLETSGLVPAIEDLLKGLPDGVVVDSSMAEPEDVDARSRAALYRVAREALANVGKHANASHVVLRMQENAKTVVLSVEDDGSGFDPDSQVSGHLGMRLMDELVAMIGGRLTVRSAPGSGTTVTVEVDRR